MAHYADTVELLVDFLSGAKHEADLPLTKPSSTVESQTAANIKSSAAAAAAAAATTASPSSAAGAAAGGGADGGDVDDARDPDEESGDNAGQQQQQQEGAKPAGSSRGRKAMTIDDDEDEEQGRFAAAEMMGDLPKAQQRPATPQQQDAAAAAAAATRSKKAGSSTTDDGGENRGSSDRKRRRRRRHSVTSGSEQQNSSLNSADAFSSGSDGVDGEEEEEDDGAGDDEDKREDDPAAVERKVQLVIVRLNQGWAAGVSGFLMENWQERTTYLLKKQFAAVKEQQRRHDAAGSGGGGDKNGRGSRRRNNQQQNDQQQNDQEQNEKESSSGTHDTSLDVSLEICTVDPKVLFNQIKAMDAQYDKHDAALQERDEAMRIAAAEAEQRRKEHDAAAAAALERKRRKNARRGKNQQQQQRDSEAGGGAESTSAALDDTVATAATDGSGGGAPSSPGASTTVAADSTIASLELAVGSFLAVGGDDNTTLERARQAFLAARDMRVPPKPAVARHVLQTIEPMLQPWIDAAHPTYLIFRRKPKSTGSSDTACMFSSWSAAAGKGGATSSTSTSTDATNNHHVLPFEFVDGVEGVDVPVMEDTLTRVCHQSRVEVASVLARHRSSLNQMRLDEFRAFGSTLSRSNVGADASDASLPFAPNSPAGWREMVAHRFSTATGITDLAAEASSLSADGTAGASGSASGLSGVVSFVGVTDDPLEAAHAAVAAAAELAAHDSPERGSPSPTEQQHQATPENEQDKNDNNQQHQQKQTEQPQDEKQPAETTEPPQQQHQSHAVLLDEDDSFTDSTVSETYDLDDVEREETQRALQSAIDVLEIAQRASGLGASSAAPPAHSPGGGASSAAPPLAATSSGSFAGGGDPTTSSSLSIATPVAFRGTSFRYPSASSTAATSSHHNQQRDGNSPDGVDDQQQQQQQQQGEKIRKSFAVPRPPPQPKPLISAAASEARMMQRVKQQTMANLPQDVLEMKKRTMSLGEYMQKVKAGVFDIAAKQAASQGGRGRGAARRRNSNRQHSVVTHEQSGVTFQEGVFFSDEDDGGGRGDDEDEEEEELSDDEEDDDEFIAGGAVLQHQHQPQQQQQWKPTSRNELVKTLFSDQPSLNVSSSIAQGDGTLAIMSEEEAAQSEQAAAQLVFGHEALQRRQREHRVATRNLVRLFPRTQKARHVAAFVIQCGWRRLCQWRRIGVVIDGKFYTHAEAAQMRRNARLRRLEARRDKLLQDKIAEIVQRIWRGAKALHVLRQLQRHASSSLKIANEYAKRKAKRTSVYCTSSVAYGSLGLPLPPPFDRKAQLLAQLELMHAQWRALCRAKEREMLEHSIYLSASMAVGAGSAAANVSARRSRSVNEEPVAAGAAASMMLFQALEKPQSVLPPQSVEVLQSGASQTSAAAIMASRVSGAGAAAAAGRGGGRSVAGGGAASSAAQGRDGSGDGGEEESSAFGDASSAAGDVEDSPALLRPQYPGNRTSAFGIVAAAITSRVAAEKEAAALEERIKAGKKPSPKRARSNSPTAAPAGGKKGGGKKKQMTREERIDAVSSLDIIGTVEVLLPRAMFAPEASWLDARAVLLSKMNEDEFAIVTTKCLCPKS